jgi:hypothetical protein
MKAQKGFAALESLLILVIIAIIGGIGWYAIHTKHQTDKILAQADKISQSTPALSKKSTPTSLNTNSTPAYLVIKEWGIKVKLGSADSSIVGYKIDNLTSCLAGPCNGRANLSLSSKVKTECEDLGIGINRRMYDVSTRLPSGSGDVAKQVGDYWYDVSGGPGSCGDPSSDAIRTQYLGNNPLSWKYSAL